MSERASRVHRVRRHVACASVSAQPRPGRSVNDALWFVTWLMTGVVGLALFVLALRSYTRLETRWDSWSYHLAYAAKLGGVHIPFHMDEQLAARFDGYPPLAHLVEGVLWRVTGSINATGVVNMIGLAWFLFVCDRLLRAPLYIVGLIALTTPVVIIHAATNYIDLFANAFLATGLVVVIHVYLYERQADRRLLVVGIGSVVAAGWSKVPLVPLAALALVLYAVVYKPWRGEQRSWLLRSFGGAVAVASLPFVRNLVIHGNPLWPTSVPLFTGDPVPRGGAIHLEHGSQVPPALVGASKPELFVRSLFEFRLPWHYADRPRWNLDQGGGQLAYRSGGFWFVGVIVFLSVMIALLLRYGGPRGRTVAIASGVGLVVVAFLPQSHVLRYYMFIPLVWAGVIGMLFPRLQRRQPALALGFCALMLVMFWTMFRANQSYFKVEHVGYTEAAQYWGGLSIWPYLRAGYVYCDVRNQSQSPRSLTLLGPTMRDFTVYVRPKVSACPKGSVPIVDNVVRYGHQI